MSLINPNPILKKKGRIVRARAPNTHPVSANALNNGGKTWHYLLNKTVKRTSRRKQEDAIVKTLNGLLTYHGHFRPTVEI